MSEGKGKILVAVGGGIAAYKAAYLVRLLVQGGYEVKGVMTPEAAQFITPLTLSALAGNPFFVEQYSDTSQAMEHIGLADWAEACVVMPATANIIGKYAQGIADDLLTTTLITLDVPVVIAPGMNTRMWNHPAVQDNLVTLKQRGVVVVPPEVGELACGTYGMGRVREMEVIVEYLEAALCKKQDFQGYNVLVTAGPTREWLDPFRFVSNPSTGKMGYALAREAARRGGKVTLISGPVSLVPPALVDTVKVESAMEMHQAVIRHFEDADVAVMAAAVADFRPVEKSALKLKKAATGLTLNMTLNPDILEELGRKKGKKVLVGFAAESHGLEQNAKAKLAAKNLDVIVANAINEAGSGFAGDTNRATLFFRDGTAKKLELMGKGEMAEKIWDAVGEIHR